MRILPSDDDYMMAEFAERFLREKSVMLTGEHNAELWKAFGEMGWLAMPLDEANGGIRASASTLAVLLEAFGHERVNEPYAVTILWALHILAKLPGNHHADLIGLIANGDMLVAVIDNGMVVTKTEEGFRISGNSMLVPGGNNASAFLVVAKCDGATALFLIPFDTAGVVVSKVDTIDNSDAADVRFQDVTAANPIDQSADLDDRLVRAKERTTALLCADAVGAMTALAEKSAVYTRTRQQFGKPLREFQVVEHFLADMQTLVEEARSAMLLAIGKIAAEPDQRRRALAAARVKIGEAGRRVGHLAVQLHGAMGVTDELDVGGYLKRLIAFDVSFGTRQDWFLTYVDLARSGAASAYLGSLDQSSDAPNFDLSPSAVSRRNEIRNLLETNLPADVSFAQRLTPTVYAEADVASRWQEIAYLHGLGAPNWPVAFGGTGWGPEERYLWAHESARSFVPITSPIGLSLVGPVLMQFGTPEQQHRYLPSIIDGSALWCQGFSEPGAGSDLAALAMRAVRDGSEYVVSGTKMWTTHGHFAHLMAALVRTGAPGGRREGISFLVIDLASPGVVVRPIITIGGDHEVNQLFFDDVRVPIGNLIGQEGQGWAIAKFLLAHERGGDIMSAGHRALLNDIRDVALGRGEVSKSFWDSFAAVSIDIDVLEVMEIRSLFNVPGNEAIASILKLRASEIQQAVTELGATLLGQDLLRRHAERPLYGDPSAKSIQAFAARYLNSRANTIFGGAREIQKGLIARVIA